MKFQYKQLFILFLIFSTLYPAVKPSQDLSPEITHELQSIKIKVLLNEYPYNSNQAFNIHAQEGLLIRTNKKTYHLKEPKLEVVLKNNTLYARSKQNAFKKLKNDQIHLKSKAAIITINNKKYHGTLSLTLDSQRKKLFLINTLDLEDYVYAVLLSEIYQTWPHEMQKIQAIVSRTYAIHQMLQRKKKAPTKRPPYDIKNTTFHQRYNGAHNYQHLREAVIETKNLIITYNDEVALAMFDGCCGGSIPAHIQGFDFAKAPYLARTTACTYCKNYSLHTWKRILSTKKFLEYLYNHEPIAKKLVSKKKLVSLDITKQDKAGVVHQLSLSQGPEHHITFSGRDLWLSMRNVLRSQNFTLKKDKHSVIFKGRGFGHQLGLCQRGARELTRKGWPVKKIIQFYYPNTTLARLKIKKEANLKV